MAARCRGIVRRAAFDIGSGMTKMQVSDVELATGRILATQFAEEREVLFAADWKQNARDGGAAAGLSGGIQQQGLEVLGALKEIALDLGAVEMRAIATEVFRKAANGSQFLERVESQLGVKASVIAQDEEARLGWLTAVAGGAAAPESVLGWDSGGGSFQITARRSDSDEMQSFLGEWGSTVASDALVSSIRGGAFTIGGDINPVSMGEAQALIAIVRESLPPPPPWLSAMLANPQTRIVGIGGATCIFRLASEVSGLLRPPLLPLLAAGAEGPPADADPAALPVLSQQLIWEGIERTVGQSDEVLSAKYLQHYMVVPKLCLCWAVMEHLSLPQFTYQPACGSCAGLAVVDFHAAEGQPRMWPEPAARVTERASL